MDNKNIHLRKLTFAALLCAAAVACSPLSIPVGTSRCFPVQHLVNILGGVFLGPSYSVGMAFVTSFVRNLMGTGTLLAFPGSMCGALIGGILYKYSKKLSLAYMGELFGTAVIGGLLAYPLAVFAMGKESALFGFVLPFFISSAGGTVIAVFLVTALKKAKVLDMFLYGTKSRKKDMKNG
ncbi:MAG: energy coupling factor transporter S component ThiW [Hominimerdicola sp.]